MQHVGGEDDVELGETAVGELLDNADSFFTAFAAQNLRVAGSSSGNHGCDGFGAKPVAHDLPPDPFATSLERDAAVGGDVLAVGALGVAVQARPVPRQVDEDVGDHWFPVTVSSLTSNRSSFIVVQGTAEGKPFDRDALDGLIDLAGAGITALVALQREIVGSYLNV